MLRYIYFIDKNYRKKLLVPEVPFSQIDEVGAGMYKGANEKREERHTECEAQIEREQRKQQSASKETETN